MKNSLTIDESLVIEALTHPSSRLDKIDIRSYERLETLGDSVLDLIVLKQLMLESPQDDPGELTKKRSMMVNNDSLAKLGKILHINKYLRTSSNYNITDKDLANAVESLFGALYVHSGVPACEEFLQLNWYQFKQIAPTFSNPIGYLQEILQKKGCSPPFYTEEKKEGPDHDPIFTIKCTVIINKQTINEIGTGNNIQKGRVDAALAMLRRINPANDL